MPQRNEQIVKAMRADEKVALAADRVAEPPRDGQDDAVGHEISRQGIGGFVARGRERARDIGQGHVDDGGVEGFP